MKFSNRQKSNPVKSCYKIRQNPSLIIDRIKYYYESDEFIGLGPQNSSRKGYHPLAKDLFEDIIRSFAKILRKKFPTIIPLVPLIIIENKHFEENYSVKETSNYGIIASYDPPTNLIYVNYNEFVERFFYEITSLENKKEIITFYVRFLMHELGHFVWYKYLNISNAVNWKNPKRDYFINYINDHMKNIDLSYLKQLAKENSERRLQLNFTIDYAIIMSLIARMETDGIKLPPPNGRYIPKYLEIYTDNYKNYLKDGKQTMGRTPKGGARTIYTFTRPVSDFMPYGKKHEEGNVEEDFYVEVWAELFANYMMSGINELHSGNYKVLKILLPELRE